MSTAADLLAEQMVADAAAQMLGAEQVAAGGSGPTSADMAAAMAMAAAAGLSPEEMAELAGGGSAQPVTSSASSSVSESDYAALVAKSLTPGSRLKRERSLSLALRTSLLCEFRNPSGLLQAFEVCYGQTTFGVLCMALSRMPGIEFLGNRSSHSWFQRPSHFVFKGELYEVSIPYDNIRIAPVEYGKAVIEMEELLEYVRHNVLRAHVSRYTIR